MGVGFTSNSEEFSRANKKDFFTLSFGPFDLFFGGGRGIKIGPIRTWIYSPPRSPFTALFWLHTCAGYYCPGTEGRKVLFILSAKRRATVSSLLTA